MNLASNNYFFSTICHLRGQEEMLIYDRFASVSIKEEKAVGEFLRDEYEREMLDFPGAPPVFEEPAAVWAALIVYNASQLLLSREKNEQDVVRLLPQYAGMVTPAAILSADLCLRCLPDVIGKAREINPDDSVILLLEEILRRWHYSGVGYFKTADDWDWGPVLADDGLCRSYVDRVIARKVTVLANLPELRPAVRAVLGDHGNLFWKELEL